MKHLYVLLRLEQLEERFKILEGKIDKMSESNTNTMNNILARLQNVSSEETVLATAVTDLVAAYKTQQATVIADLRAQLAAAVANSQPIDATAALAMLDSLDASMTAAATAARDAVVAPPV